MSARTALRSAVSRVLLAAGALIAVAASPAPVEPEIAKVTTLARNAGFDGTILIGRSDGSSLTVPVGVDPVPVDAVWRWASITKQLTAVMAMQEVARGTLDLDAPVSRYWPEWPARYADQIRIRDLLLHESGLANPDDSPPDGQGVPGFYRGAVVPPEQSASGYCASAPGKAPRGAFAYNNCDAIVLGEVLRRITGKTVPELFADRIGRPLGMTDFGLYEVGESRPESHVRPIGEGRDNDPLIDLGAYGAAGSAYGTIADLWRFDHALIAGKLLDPSQRDEMWSSAAEDGWRALFQWSYPARIAGCAKPVRVIERQGLIEGIELRNYLLPERGEAVILFGRKRPLAFGQPWEGKGLAHDLIAQVACS
ncbi:serine hydrolase domain-containing protein [Novosphingobium aquimarinum]|uniref:serine hydrolase domain-containing protein n=1 Tax=Novosphingobium aquimarinum TaxID=2682494 RepID=UPI0012EBE4C9|nr:serine hydrolase domain-containing protein [Novosphingobium aquimarinum]